jgi:hypothetical protein
MEKQPSTIRGWRRRLAMVMVVLASVLIPIAVLGSWVRAVGLESQAWAAISGSILDDPVVRDRVSHELVDRLFDAAQPEDVLGERLPPRLQFLAGPLSSSARQTAYERVDRLLASDDFQQAWREANVDAHREVVAIIESRSEYVDESDGKVELDVRPLLTLVADRIGLEGRLVARIPDDAAIIDLGLEDELEQIRSALRIIRAVTIGIIVLSVALLVGAIGLGWPIRARIVRWIANGILLGGVGMLAVRSVGGQVVQSRVGDDPVVLAIANTVWDVATSGIAAAGWIAVSFALVVRVVVSVMSGRHAATAGRSMRTISGLVRRFPAGAHAVWMLVLAGLLIVRPATVAEHAIATAILVAGFVVAIEMLRRSETSEQLHDEW